MSNLKFFMLFVFVIVPVSVILDNWYMKRTQKLAQGKIIREICEDAKKDREDNGPKRRNCPLPGSECAADDNDNCSICS